MMNRFETYFDANYTYYTTQSRRILKSIGLFENVAFVIMSTRENIRLIARATWEKAFGPSKLRNLMQLKRSGPPF